MSAILVAGCASSCEDILNTFFVLLLLEYSPIFLYIHSSPLSLAMLVRSATRFISLCASAAWANPLQTTDGQAMELSTSPNITGLILPSNVSALNLNASIGRGFDIRCDGANYGYSPDIADCEGAREYITPDSTQMEFGERHTGLPGTVFPLPFLMMGGKLKDAQDV